MKKVISLLLITTMLMPNFSVSAYENDISGKNDEIISGSSITIDDSETFKVNIPYGFEYTFAENNHAYSEYLRLFSAGNYTSYSDLMSAPSKNIYGEFIKNIDPENITEEKPGLYRLYVPCPVDENITLGNRSQMVSVASEIIMCLRLEHPELHWLSQNIIFSQKGLWFYTVYTDDNYTLSINKETVLRDIAAVNEWKDSIVKTAKTYPDSYSQQKYVNDAICKSTTYGENAIEAYSGNVSGIAVYGKAVCEGYAKANKLILDELGIPCVEIFGTGNGGSHAWNAIRMEDDKWYQTDVTWNDTAETNRYFLTGENVMSIAHSFENELGLDLALDAYVYDPNASSSSSTSTTENQPIIPIKEPDTETTTAVYDNYIYTVKDNKATIIGCSERIRTDGDIIIPSKINGYDVIAVGDSAFESKIYAPNSRLIISDGIQTLGSHAFYNIAVDQIYIPKSVTEFVKNEWGYVFSYSESSCINVAEDNPMFCSIDGALYLFH